MKGLKIGDVLNVLEEWAPLNYQENYDNSGLIIGNKDDVCTGVLCALDVTEAIINEAIQQSCNLIIAHHPLIFSPLKKVTSATWIERCVVKAIKNNINIYALHTNADNIIAGVNYTIAEKLKLTKLKILQPKNKVLKKLVSFVPISHIDSVRQALFNAGCGHIGNYDSCSFNTTGIGTFRGNQHSNPFIGEKEKLSEENEVRIETIFESHKEKKVITALLNTHPYEEVAYDIYQLDNYYNNVGSGMIGELETAISVTDFLKKIKEVFKVECVRYTDYNNPIKKIAFCGGSGSFLLSQAVTSGADAFLSSDFKYHQFFDADNKLLIADIGHFEAEQYTPEIFCALIQKKFPTFAVHLSKINTNPVKYF